MKFLATVLTLTLPLAGTAFATPDDPRLIQGTLEWPPTVAGGELFLVLRGDDQQIYYVDVAAARRQGEGVLTAGSRMALVGREGIKSHKIVAVAFGSGDAAALSLALARETLTAPPTVPRQPTTPPAGAAAPQGASPAVPPASPTGSREADTRTSPPPAKPAQSAPVNQGSWTGPREVVFPNGKYVLSGDGARVPYRWIWIPGAPAVSPPTPPR